MRSLGGRSGSVGRRRKGFYTCGSEVSAGKFVREVKLRVSGVARRPRCKIVSVNWYGAGRLLVRARRPQWRPGARLSGKVAPGAPHLAPGASCSQKVASSLFLIVFGVPGVCFGRFLSRFGGFGTFRDCW
ncbi:hypothetical protein LR48_Vigan02g025300 [Vigna angularis]|uniref:Uncharacterized protein n=1 Tax=Phaseolus angularis TaxID=3914 RepID=A0A0L9TU36_PHAAN|nr:hypothetical protein LR48_Vigan02g025300 [Vigna angularis]